MATHEESRDNKALTALDILDIEFVSKEIERVFESRKPKKEIAA